MPRRLLSLAHFSHRPPPPRAAPAAGGGRRLGRPGRRACRGWRGCGRRCAAAGRLPRWLAAFVPHVRVASHQLPGPHQPIVPPRVVVARAAQRPAVARVAALVEQLALCSRAGLGREGAKEGRCAHMHGVLWQPAAAPHAELPGMPHCRPCCCAPQPSRAHPWAGGRSARSAAHLGRGLPPCGAAAAPTAAAAAPARRGCRCSCSRLSSSRQSAGAGGSRRPAARRRRSWRSTAAGEGGRSAGWATGAAWVVCHSLRKQTPCRASPGHRAAPEQGPAPPAGRALAWSAPAPRRRAAGAGSAAPQADARDHARAGSATGCSDRRELAGRIEVFFEMWGQSGAKHGSGKAHALAARPQARSPGAAGAARPAASPRHGSAALKTRDHGR